MHNYIIKSYIESIYTKSKVRISIIYTNNEDTTELMMIS